jgi:hypothetical protein
MKGYITFLLAIAIMPMQVYAQDSGVLSDELNQELDQIYGSPKANEAAQPTIKLKRSKTKPAPAQPIDTVHNSFLPDDGELNGGRTSINDTVAIQQQQPTNVESSPLEEPPSDAMRKKRQQVELDTELKIVEKLESSRLVDEKRRQDKLFGKKLTNLENENDETPVAAAPIVRSAPIEMRAPMPEIKALMPSKKSYFGVGLGAGNYPTASNIIPYQSFTGFVGHYVAPQMIIEGGLSYANFDIRKVLGSVNFFPEITEMDQYVLSGVFRYQFRVSESFKPNVGALVAYTYRNYTDTRYLYTPQSASSSAFDVGIVTGADLVVSEGFTVGADLKYLVNLTNRTNYPSNNNNQNTFDPYGFGYNNTNSPSNPYNNNYNQNNYQPYYNNNPYTNNGGTPVEELGYYIFTISGKYSF